MTNKLFLIFLLLPGWLSAQTVLPTQQQIERFYASKTYVVLEPDGFSPYNIYIQDAVKKYWKATQYEVIKYKRFQEIRKDTTCSFLLVTQTRYERDKSKILYNYLDLMLGANVPTLTEMPLFGSIPLSYPDTENENYSYKLGIMIRFLQNRVENLKNQPGISGMRYLRYYNKNTKEIKEHLLLLSKDDLPASLKGEGALDKYYPHPYKVVNPEEMEKIISEGTEDVLFTHLVGPHKGQRFGWSIKLIFGLKDARIYYYSKHVISEKKPNGFLITDWKKIAR